MKLATYVVYRAEDILTQEYRKPIFTTDRVDADHVITYNELYP